VAPDFKNMGIRALMWEGDLEMMRCREFRVAGEFRDQVGESRGSEIRCAAMKRDDPR